MCTISWLYDHNGYHIFFNRDEQRTREKAQQPKVHNVAGCKAIFPVDAKAGGTWIAANEYGLTFALLNYYQAAIDTDAKHLRGLIIPSLLPAKNVAEAHDILKRVNLKGFGPFSLLCFSPQAAGGEKFSDANRRVPLLRWNGIKLEKVMQTSPLISSAVDYENVNAVRSELYRNIFREKTALQPMDFYRYHATHTPVRGHLSVCMHREDARTVSFSHVAVGHHVVAFTYLDSAPCCSVSDGVEQGRNLNTATLIRKAVAETSFA